MPFCTAIRKQPRTRLRRFHVRRIFGRGRGALPSVSRDVLRAGPDATALRDAARRLRDGFACLRA
jgi:hypothetical protein